MIGIIGWMGCEDLSGVWGALHWAWRQGSVQNLLLLAVTMEEGFGKHKALCNIVYVCLEPGPRTNEQRLITGTVLYMVNYGPLIATSESLFLVLFPADCSIWCPQSLPPFLEFSFFGFSGTLCHSSPPTTESLWSLLLAFLFFYQPINNDRSYLWFHIDPLLHYIPSHGSDYQWFKSLTSLLGFFSTWMSKRYLKYIMFKPEILSSHFHQNLLVLEISVIFNS